MAMSVPRGGSNVKAEPNVTPMIDVMLVLLIIFMIVIPTITSGFQAEPPAGQNLKPRPPEDGEQILGIDANGQYYLNRKAIPNASLGSEIAKIYNVRTEDKVLYIKADKNLEYSKVRDALDIAAQNGVRVSAMISDQRPGARSKVESDNLGPNVTTSETVGP